MRGRSHPILTYFRPVSAESLDVLLPMMACFYEEQQMPFDREIARHAVEGLLAQPQFGGVWLIESNGVVAGYVVLTIGYSLEFHGRDGLIDELYIEPDARGGGLGSEALAFIERECRSRDIRAVHLQVGHENPRALALYRRSGFEAHHRYFMTRWL